MSSPREPHRPLIWPDVVFDLQSALEQYSDAVYIVGGAVRDALLHRPLKDIDLATPGNAVQLARHLANRMRGDFYILDSERDVGRALVNTPDGRIILDVAHFRGDDLLADLSDRDFTINAMAVDVKGDLSLLIDPLNGERDMQQKVLRRCAENSILDDPLRALRAVRQSVQSGLRIEPQTLEDVKACAPRLMQTSPERVRDEFIKVLSLPTPAPALRIAEHVGLLQVILPEIAALREDTSGGGDLWGHTLAVIEKLTSIIAVLAPQRTDSATASFGLGMLAIQLDKYRAQFSTHLTFEWPNERPHRALLMLAALLSKAGKPVVLRADNPKSAGFEAESALLADERASALRLSNAERQHVVSAIRHQFLPLALEDLSAVNLHRFWRQQGIVGIDICLLALADYLATAAAEFSQDAWLEIVDRTRVLLSAFWDQYDTLVEPPQLVDGNQLIRELKLKPGPMVGRLLELIREGQVSGEVSSIEDALQLAQHYLKNHLNGAAPYN